MLKEAIVILLKTSNLGAHFQSIAGTLNSFELRLPIAIPCEKKN